MSRSRLLLLLVVFLLLAVWYAWQQTPRQQHVSTKSAVRSGVTTASRPAALAPVSLVFNDESRTLFNKPKRDIFRPLFRPPAVSKKIVEKPQPVPVVVKPPPPPPQKIQPVIKPVVGPKPIQPLTVLGFLKKDDVKTAFLASKQGELYLVKKGDRFADDLLVKELDEGELVVSRGPDDQGVTLKVGQKKTQRMAIPKVSSGRPSVPVPQEPAPAKQ